MKRLRWLQTKLSERSIPISTRIIIGLAVLTSVLCLGDGRLLRKGAANSAQTGACTKTAETMRKACDFEVQNSYALALARCDNLSDATADAKCRRAADAALKEDKDLCDAQMEARLDLCEDLGEAPYDPKIVPANFVDPGEIGKSVRPNPYLPLLRGVTWIYKGGTQTTTVTVTGNTRKILGVTCAIVHDVVEDNGEVIEDTTDWIAQDLAGNVWYFGESVQDFENGILVAIDGSFTAGVDGDKPGILMKAAPKIGEVFRQEFSLGNAEDIVEITSLKASAVSPFATCNGDCLSTDEFTPIEPDFLEQKFYKPGVGKIVTFNPATGARSELVQIRNAAGLVSAINVSGVYPNAASRGERVSLAINGSGFTPESRVSLGGGGIRVFTQYISSTQLLASLLITDNALTTTRDLVVKNPGGDSSTKVDAFWVKP